MMKGLMDPWIYKYLYVSAKAFVQIQGAFFYSCRDLHESRPGGFRTHAAEKPMDSSYGRLYFEHPLHKMSKSITLNCWKDILMCLLAVHVQRASFRRRHKAVADNT